MIPSAVKAAEVSSKGKSIYAYEPNSTVSKAYTEFTKEVLAEKSDSIYDEKVKTKNGFNEKRDKD